MGMVGCFYSLRDEDLEAIISHPPRIKNLWTYAPMVEPKAPSLLGRLFGAKSTAAPEAREAWKPSEQAEEFDVDKAWHGIHFLLTGSDWEGEGPLAFVLNGGREINEDLGYGPSHAFSSAEVKEISKALDALNVDELYSQADPAQFAANEIYPEIWTKESKEDSIGYVTENLEALREFVRKTAQKNRALIAYLG